MAEYLLQNCGAGYLGNSPVFWRKGGSGYTQWIDEAKRWTKEEAEQTMRSTEGTHRWKLWPVRDIELVARRTVDIQDLQRLEAAATLAERMLVAGWVEISPGMYRPGPELSSKLQRVVSDEELEAFADRLRNTELTTG